MKFLITLLFGNLVWARAISVLMPGFEGRQLEAVILREGINATTIRVTCPTALRADHCGIPSGELTAIVAPTAARLIQTNSPNNIAEVSCDLKGTTDAFCHAQQIISTQGLLASKDLNWMEIPIVATITKTLSVASTVPTSVLADTTLSILPSKTQQVMHSPTVKSGAISPVSLFSTLYQTGMSVLAGFMGSVALDLIGWRMPPFLVY